MNADQKAEFIEALNYARDADSQNSRKGVPLRQWFKGHFGVDSGISVVNEDKQIGNRIIEQFKDHRPVDVFLCKNVSFVPRILDGVRKRVYPELRAVYCFLEDGPSNYKLRAVLSVPDYRVTTEITSSFTPAEEHKLDTVPLPAPKPEAPDIPWSAFPGSADACGLVGLQDALETSLAALASGKHVILIGPPGCGKTELAKCLCKTVGIPSFTATATSEWTTADTIGGYFPVIAEESGGSVLDFRPGIISRAIDNDEWLVIDEINRADIDKAFGELFTALGGTTVRLPFQKRVEGAMMDVVLGLERSLVEEDVFKIRISDTWRLIGTMNSFDKASLYQLSLAFMRRFAFVPVKPPKNADYQALIEREFERLQATPAAATPASERAHESLREAVENARGK